MHAFYIGIDPHTYSEACVYRNFFAVVDFLFFPSSCHSQVNVVLLSHVSLRFRWLALLAALELDRVWKWKEQQTLPHPLLLSLMLRLSIQIQIHYLSPHIFSLLPLRQLKILIFHVVRSTAMVYRIFYSKR